MLKIRQRDKINTQVLKKTSVKESFYRNMAKPKLAYAGHVFKGRSGINAALMSEIKMVSIHEVGQERMRLITLRNEIICKTKVRIIT